MVIDDFDLCHIAPKPRQCRRGVGPEHQGMRMHDILGAELPITKMEGHALAEEEGPFFQVCAGLPAFGEAGSERSGDRIHVQQSFQKRVKL